MISNKIAPLLPEYLLHSEIFSVVITDMEGKYLFVNDVFKKRFAFITQEWEGKDSFIAIYPEDHQVCLQAVEQCLANPDKVVKVQLRKPDTNEKDFYWIQWEFSVFKDQQQNPIGILCLGHDITETERASRQAKEFAHKVETIIEEITEGFYQLDREWKFVKVNKVAEQILGVTREQLLGRKIWDLFPDTPDYNYPAAYRKAMEENLSVTFEDYRPDLDRWFSAVCYPSPEGLTVFFSDVTQEKKNQIALEESEKQLQLNFALLTSVFESPNDIIIFSLDKNYCYTSFTQLHKETIKKIWGVDIRIGVNMLEIISNAKDRAKAKENFDRALKGESFSLIEEYGDEKLYRTFYQDYYYPVKNKFGEIIGLSVFVIDITEAKKTQIALEESEIKLRAILNSSTESNLLISPQGKIINFNKKAQELAQSYLKKDLYIGADVLDFLTPEGIEAFETYFPKALQGEIHTLQTERQTKEGSIWIEATYLPVYDKNNQLIGVTLTTQNITKKKQTELQLQENEERLQKIVEAIPHPLLIVSEDMEIQYVNDEFENVFGYTSDEVLSKTVDFLLPERFRAGHSFLQKNYLEQGGKTVKQMGRSLSALTKSGKEIVIDASLNTFFFNKKKYVIVILQDVTELKQRQDTILQQNEILQKIAWQQSHELRRPVANILGLCDLLKNYPNETTEIQKQYIDYMLKATQELDEIIHRIVKQTNEK